MAWRTLRAVRWALWIALVGCTVYYVNTPMGPRTDQFGHLTPATELLIFSLCMGPGLVGLFEMMMRDKAGIPRKPPS